MGRILTEEEKTVEARATVGKECACPEKNNKPSLGSMRKGVKISKENFSKEGRKGRGARGMERGERKRERKKGKEKRKEKRNKLILESGTGLTE